MKQFFGAAFAMALVLGGVSTAGAGIEPFDPTLTLSPSKGPAGTSVTISGSTCFPREGGQVLVAIPGTRETGPPQTFAPEPNGDWSTTLTIADDVAEDDTIVIDGVSCVEFGGDADREDPYDPTTFTVTAAPTTTVDETTTTTEAEDEEADDTDEEVEAVEAADAAEPVVAQPTFTG